MSDHAQGNPYRVYWITWSILLVITVLMLMAEKFHLPPWSLILFLVAFMMVKATMISGTFSAATAYSIEPRPSTVSTLPATRTVNTSPRF